MKNITSLRNHLFDALNRLADATENDIELQMQKSTHIVIIAEAIVKTCEVENTFLNITKGVGSGFIPFLADNNNAKNILITDEDQSHKEIDRKPEIKMFNENEEKNWLIDGGDKVYDNPKDFKENWNKKHEDNYEDLNEENNELNQSE